MSGAGPGAGRKQASIASRFPWDRAVSGEVDAGWGSVTVTKGRGAQCTGSYLRLLSIFYELVQMGRLDIDVLTRQLDMYGQEVYLAPNTHLTAAIKSS